MFLGIFLIEIVLIFLTSHYLFKSLSVCLLRIFRKQSIVITVLSIFFLLGVVIHELSHFLVAEVLLVRTGEIEFLPEIRGDTVKLGSVQVAQTDIFRRFLIGVAPVILGIMLVGILAWYAGQDFSFQKMISSWPEFAKYIIILYGIFAVSNTMFSSKKDLEGAIGILVIFCVVILTIVIADNSITMSILNVINSSAIVSVFQRTDVLFSIPLAINLFFSSILRAVLRRSS